MRSFFAEVRRQRATSAGYKPSLHRALLRKKTTKTKTMAETRFKTFIEFDTQTLFTVINNREKKDEQCTNDPGHSSPKQNSAKVKKTKRNKTKKTLKSEELC